MGFSFVLSLVLNLPLSFRVPYEVLSRSFHGGDMTYHAFSWRFYSVVVVVYSILNTTPYFVAMKANGFLFFDWIMMIEV